MNTTTETEQVVWVIPTPKDFPPPLMAYSPSARIGCTPRAPNTPDVLWFAVDGRGVPIEPGAVPEPHDGPLRDMLLYRLAQAYATLTYCHHHTPDAKA
jgi:hypothetical protein